MPLSCIIAPKVPFSNHVSFQPEGGILVLDSRFGGRLISTSSRGLTRIHVQNAKWHFRAYRA